MTIGKIIVGGILGLAGIVAAAANESSPTKPQQEKIYVGHLLSCDKKGDGYSFSAKRCKKVGEENGEDVFSEDSKTFRFAEDNVAYNAIFNAWADGKDVSVRAPAYDIDNKAVISITPDQIVEFSDQHDCGCPEE